MTAWWAGPLLAFDTETTGTNVETDRIVTAALAWITPGQGVVTRHHLIDPGVEIPEEAARVHGITTEYARAHGSKPAPALDEIARDLAGALRAGQPLVCMNAAFDLTLLDRELRRHSLATLEQRLGRPVAPVVDVLVLDRYIRPRARGRRTLAALCEAWGVRLDGTHDAAYDALAAARVAWRMGRTTPEIGRMPLEELHRLQVRERARQQAEMRKYFEWRGLPHDGCPPDWPLIPYTPTRSNT